MNDEKKHAQHDHDREAEREAVVAADDTGMVRQQELLHDARPEDRGTGDEA